MCRQRAQNGGEEFAIATMTEFILPPVLGLAAISIGIGLGVTPPIIETGRLPVVIQLSNPIGTPASAAMKMAHPVMPEANPVRAVRVVLTSPFVQR